MIIKSEDFLKRRDHFRSINLVEKNFERVAYHVESWFCLLYIDHNQIGGLTTRELSQDIY